MKPTDFTHIFLASASALSIILLVILFLLFKQMKKLNKAKQDIDLLISFLN
jgi:phosphoglycerol transferase MdoB-like AlkP superfamily enzyme